MEENESKIETEKDRKTLMKREDGDFELIEVSTDLISSLKSLYLRCQNLRASKPIQPFKLLKAFNFDLTNMWFGEHNSFHVGNLFLNVLKRSSLVLRF